MLFVYYLYICNIHPRYMSYDLYTIYIHICIDMKYFLCIKCILAFLLYVSVTNAKTLYIFFLCVSSVSIYAPLCISIGYISIWVCIKCSLVPYAFFVYAYFCVHQVYPLILNTVSASQINSYMYFCTCM